MTGAITKSEKSLIIVESPNKVKTIADILNKAGYKKAVVTASVGHIMKLADGGTAFNSGICPEKNFEMNLVIDPTKSKIVKEITEKAGKVDKVFLMTDGDREGELIAWSLLHFCNLPEDKCFRAITREITPSSVIKSLLNPTTLNYNLVHAGFARMMTDKLIGYGLSPIGKKYIGAKSIGRCQSVGLKLVADREDEIQTFVPEIFYKPVLTFVKNDTEFVAKYCGYSTEKIDKFKNELDANMVIKSCEQTQFFVTDIEQKTVTSKPPAPFCTATFQQEAANVLNLKVKDAMSCAQKLFEGISVNGEHVGLITYMRTDSTEISKDFLPALESYILSTFGNGHFKVNLQRQKTNQSHAQYGHEALRITDPSITPDMLDQHVTNKLLVKVYKLIWQRTIASMMQKAEYVEQHFTISNNNHHFSLSKKYLINPGYLQIYDKQAVNVNELFTLNELLNTQLTIDKQVTSAKARFTEAGLVSELEQRGIGRPSTYAAIIETLLNPSRGYASCENKHIVPTQRGLQLSNYCDRAFSSIINLKYTKDLEQLLDKIADGKLALQDYMTVFYDQLNQVIKNTDETGITETLPEKLCPICNSQMVVRRSRFGKLFYGCTAYPACRGLRNID